MNFDSSFSGFLKNSVANNPPPASVDRRRTAVMLLLLVGAAGYPGCSKAPPAAVEDAALRSAITVAAPAGEPITLKSAAAEFDILPSGYIQPFLLQNEKRLALDEPEAGSAASSDALVSAGKEIRDFTLDFSHAKISASRGKLGTRGQRVEITGRGSTAEAAGIEKLLAVEVYDDFPSLALTTVTYKNVGSKAIKLDRVVTERRRLNASLADPTAAPYDLWSFQGSSYDWGKDEILRISKNFSQPNVMGGPGPKGQGGGIPVIDFWTKKVGEAIGHLDTLPLVLSLPVQVAKDGRISVSMVLEPDTTLKPGEVYSTPHSFIMVHSGDFYESLSLWSSALQRQGWNLPKPTNADYSANWCGWGYEAHFTPAQMLGTIPKLKDLNIPTATLDYYWFDSFGDWNPRSDTFPGDAIKKVVDEYHKQGILITLWWQPLGVEDGQGKPSLGKPMTTAKLVVQHPDWMILDKNGKRARLISPVCTVAAMCPALPEVQAYHKELTERFIRDWGFDGNKIDSAFSVPPCYNPAHKHKSPEDSINAVADLYRVILETTRSLKPESVT